ncbi:MAG: ABC transporter ATP-binding protein [Halanaerobiales bacterium]
MLKINSIKKVFAAGSINEKIALNNLSLSLEEGEFVTIIGDNGAGKSTLLNCIAGEYIIDEGQILLDDIDITYLPEYKRSQYIGRVFQDPLKGTAYDMTIAENLAIAYAKGKPKGLRPGINKKDIELFRGKLSLLHLGLEDRLNQKVGLLSGGQRQALTLLMATIVKPKLLLLDEHIAALDPKIAEKILQLTGEIVKKENISTLMITHNMKAALDHGTRTIMMHEGQIILDIKGKEREDMTIEKLIDQFGKKARHELEDDRILLSK